jgi:thiosulfate reductase cytochrome b subunit
MSEASRHTEPGPNAELGGGDLVRRHRVSTRIWHWLNAVTLIVMLMSGLMIFNAHPRLYWGEYGANFDHAWLEIGAVGDEGVLRVGAVTIPPTGVLGVWTDGEGTVRRTAFPHWATIPSSYDLASGRLWHLAFAWVLGLSLFAYLLWSLVNGHLRRDIHITRAEWRPSRLLRDVKAYARLRFPVGAAALRYNVLQKLAYAGVLFGLLPLAILTGLAMSPAMDAAWPWLTVIWGGRQSARSLHFLAAFGLVVFVALHVVMVALTGPANQLRAMITGWYRLPREPSE